MRIRKGNNYSWYRFPTQEAWCRWSSHIWTHVLYIHCQPLCGMHICGCVFSCKVILTDFIYKIWEKKRVREIERERSDCVVSWDHGDYACGHWLPSLSTPKAWRIRINEVGMLSGCQTHAGCCLVVPPEYWQLVLDRRQLQKFNLENTGQSLMRHQLSWYRVKWAHWQCTTSISLKTIWQRA